MATKTEGRNKGKCTMWVTKINFFSFHNALIVSLFLSASLSLPCLLYDIWVYFLMSCSVLSLPPCIFLLFFVKAPSPLLSSTNARTTVFLMSVFLSQLLCLLSHQSKCSLHSRQLIVPYLQPWNLEGLQILNYINKTLLLKYNKRNLKQIGRENFSHFKITSLFYLVPWRVSIWSSSVFID